MSPSLASRAFRFNLDNNGKVPCFSCLLNRPSACWNEPPLSLPREVGVGRQVLHHRCGSLTINVRNATFASNDNNGLHSSSRLDRINYRPIQDLENLSESW